MAINKVEYAGNVLIDLTTDSVTPDALVEGKTAHGKDGSAITGTNPYAKSETDATVDEQADLISQIKTALNGKVSGGGEPVEPTLQEKSVTPTKSAQEITDDSGYDGLSKVSVGAIPDQYIVPSGTKSITTNGTYDVTDKASVSVNVPIPDGYIKPSGTLEVTENGTYNVTEKASVTVAVPETVPQLQEKTVTENGEVVADEGYDGLSKVTVNVSTNVLGYTVDDFNDSTISGALVVNGTKVRSYCFYNFRNVTSISAPNATSLEQWAFGYCINAESLDLPEVTTLANGSLRNLHKLTNIVLPKVTSVAGYALYYLLGATKIDLPVCTNLEGYALAYSNKLQHLILRSPTVCTLKNVNCFVATPYQSTGTGGYVYVPSDLVSEYQSATNWSALAVTFRAIEDYPDICG